MTLARAANRAFARQDFDTFDLLASLADMSGRERDHAIRNMTDDELEAVSVLSTTTPTPERAAS